MDRRSIIMGLAAGAAAGPAFAQAARTAGTSAAEAEHAKRTAMVGAAALQTSDVALGKAKDARVKEFAQFEHDEQTTVAEILKSMDPAMTPPGPDPKMADVITKLRSMEAGPEFDRMYVTAQIEGHEMLLKIQEDYLKAGKVREHVNVTKLVRGMVKEHLTLLGHLKSTMG